MRRALIIVLLMFFLIEPVYAAQYTAPAAPESGQEYMPRESGTFAEDLLYVLKTAIQKIRPDIAEAGKLCLGILCAVFLISVVQNLAADKQRITMLAGTVVVSCLLLSSVNSMIDLGVETVTELSEYGKLLLPIMTAALAAQGGIHTSTALYAGTAAFTAILSTVIRSLLIPILYLYLCIAVANCAIGENILKRITDFLKWLTTWSLKIILYVFSAYMTITGVISGSTDATALKAAKITISGAVPVVGGILADASETILVGADVMKNAAGAYGLIAFAAILVGPFLQIGIQYLFMKLTVAVSEIFDAKGLSGLLNDFSSVMGFLLAMTGTVCLLLMISVVCFMKGIG